jgi:hypothetical protein
MRLLALCHTEMAGELAALRAAVSSATKSVLGHSPSVTFHMEVVDELTAEFQKMEDPCSWLERPITRIYNLLLGTPLGQARLADRLDEAIGQLRVELAPWWEADAELEALRTSATQVRDLVLGSTNRLSSLAMSMSVPVELLEGRIDAIAANGARWASHSALVAVVLHFPELEVLGSRRSADLTEDEAGILWT